MMELKVTPYEQPKAIEFNFEELKAELEERVHVYETTVYNDEQIQQAKADRADLNKLKKAINDERIRREREYMEPFNTFKTQIGEIIKIIDKPVAVIDAQVKDYETREKEERREKINAYWEGELQEDLTTRPPEWLKLCNIWQDRWLNKSVSIAAAKQDIKKAIAQIQEDVATLTSLPEFGFEAVEVYKTTLDMNTALNTAREMSEIQKRKEAAEKARLEAEMRAQAEAEAQAAAEQTQQEPEPAEAPADPEPVPYEEPKVWVSFAALLTAGQAKELKAFFEERGIQYKPIANK